MRRSSTLSPPFTRCTSWSAWRRLPCSLFGRGRGQRRGARCGSGGCSGTSWASSGAPSTSRSTWSDRGRIGHVAQAPPPDPRLRDRGHPRGVVQGVPHARIRRTDEARQREGDPSVDPERRRALLRAVLPCLPRRQGGREGKEHTSELQSQFHLVCRLLLEKK